METVMNQPSAHLLYGVTKEQPFIMRAVIELEDKIDPVCLTKAVDCVRRRFPYLCMQVDMESEADFRILPNDRPIVVYEGKERRPLMSEETNGHIMAASYMDRWIYFDLNHAFADGRFCVEVTKTLLYYYLEEKYHHGIDPAGILLLEDEITDEERFDPMEQRVKDAIERIKHQSTKETVNENSQKPERPIISPADFGFDEDYRQTLSIFKVDEEAFMNFARGLGASPAIVCSALSALALYRCAEQKKAVSLGVVQDLRSAFGVRNSHHNLLTFLTVDYETSVLDQGDVAALAAMTKRRIKAGVTPEETQKKAESMVEMIAKVLMLPTREERQAFMKKCAITGMDTKSMMVSYVGKCPMGALEPYIRSYYPVVSVYSDLGVGALSLNHHFFFTIGHCLKEDRFGEEFLLLLQECGLNAAKEEDFMVK